MKAATKVREMEKADYDAMHKDYSESVDALNRAIAVLKKQAYDRSCVVIMFEQTCVLLLFYLSEFCCVVQAESLV